MMQTSVVIAFALLFWRAETSAAGLISLPEHAGWTWAFVFLPPGILVATAFAFARRLKRRLATQVTSADRIHRAFGRLTLLLRTVLLLSLAWTLFGTRWPEWVGLQSIHPVLQIFSDWCVLAPFLLSIVLFWVAGYPLEAGFRLGQDGEMGTPTWLGSGLSLGHYLDFQIRQHLLTTAVPMTLILATANVVRGYESGIENLVGSVWGPDLVLGAVAVGIFLVSPSILRHIWRTRRLDAGPLRDQLEILCRRIGLRVRDILVWNSHGMMINAAVMGVVARFRFVLLSDALLDTMSPMQIQAVFGHEAGHVRHRHIQHLLAFAFVGWVVVAGIVELGAGRGAYRPSELRWSSLVLPGFALAAAIVGWSLLFGWLSRRFEHQADLFGVRCATPPALECRMPCSLHLETQAEGGEETRVCGTGSAIYSSALDRVAFLNGIPRHEQGWRHPSISRRTRLLAVLAGDPAAARRFHRGLWKCTIVTRAGAAIGAVVSILYGLYAY